MCAQQGFAQTIMANISEFKRQKLVDELISFKLNLVLRC